MLPIQETEGNKCNNGDFINSRKRISIKVLFIQKVFVHLTQQLKTKIMKVEIKQNVGNEVLHFPKLMISDVTNRVVLFTEPKVGINIKEGDFKDRWDMTQFKDFKGTITITQ